VPDLALEVTPDQVSWIDWSYMADQALYGFATLGSGLGGALVQCALLAVVIHRRHHVQRVLSLEDPGSDLVRRWFHVWPELLSASLLLVPLIIEGASLAVRVESVQAALQPIDPSGPATLLSAGVKERLYGPVLASMMIGIQALPAALTLALGTHYRLRLRGALLGRGAGESGPMGEAAQRAYREHPCPGLGFFLALGAAAGATLVWFFASVTEYAKGCVELCAAVVGVPPVQKLQLLMAGFDELEEQVLGRLFLVGGAAVITAATAFVYLHFFSAAPARHRHAPQLPRWPALSRRGYITALALCLGGAALCALLARPMYLERHTPPPLRSAARDMFMFMPDMNLPALNGPDGLERSPVLRVTAPAGLEPYVTFNGVEAFERRLAKEAQRRRKSWRRFNPKEPFPGLVALVCSKKAQLAPVISPLRVLWRAGYRTVQLTFVKTETVHRPLLGSFPNHIGSAARVHLAPTPPPGCSLQSPEDLDTGSLPRDGKVCLRLDPDTRYTALAQAAVAARRTGSRVWIDIGTAADQ